MDIRLDDDPLLEGSPARRPSNKYEHGSIRDSDTRFLVLLLAALACLGDYVNTNLVKSFEEELKTHFGGLSQSQFNLLYFIAPEVNIILPLIAGFLITRFNIKLPFHWFAVIAILGQAIVTIALFSQIWTIMVIGRAVGALGGASLAVARSVIVSKWFAGKELSFALGAHLIVLVLGRHLGYYMVLWVSTWSSELSLGILSESMGISLGFLAGTMGCCCSWYAVFHLCDWDERADRQEEESGTRQPESLHFKLHDLKKLKLVFYLTILVIATIELGFTSFVFDPTGLVKRFGFNDGEITITFDLISLWLPALSVPFIGLFIDRKGKRMMAIIISFAVFCAASLLIHYLGDGTPMAIIVILSLIVGVCYSIQQAVIWPCIALVVEDRLLGVAFGFAYSIVNLSNWVWSKLNPPKSLGHVWSGILLTGMLVLGAVFTYLLYLENKKKDVGLEKPGTKRKKSGSPEGRQELQQRSNNQI